ncbi:MAG: hypothetical protein LBP28_07860 [Coriobacteriales bacterium]|jgi:hypothetical protein|nr:hypothetical protein [Coriobacteriales bacterium]
MNRESKKRPQQKEPGKAGYGWTSFIPAVLLFLLSVAFVAVIALYDSAPAFANSISRVEYSIQDVNGMKTVNYMPILAEDVNWEELSDVERAGIARFAISSAARLAKEDGATDFNTMGLSADGRQPVFLYTDGEMFTLYLNEESYTLALDDSDGA